MGSLATCGKRHKISSEDLADIKREAALLKADGYSGPESIQKAVVSHIKELIEERESVIKNIRTAMVQVET